MLENLLKLLAQGQDNPMLRLGIGKSYPDQDEFDSAIVHLKACLQQDPNYSAAWKLLGRAYALKGDTELAIAAYRDGIRVASARGDKQAEKEMQVFLRRLMKN